MTSRKPALSRRDAEDVAERKKPPPASAGISGRDHVRVAAAPARDSRFSPDRTTTGFRCGSAHSRRFRRGPDRLKSDRTRRHARFSSERDEPRRDRSVAGTRMPPGRRFHFPARACRILVRKVMGPIRPRRRRCGRCRSAFFRRFVMFDASRRDIRCAFHPVGRIPVPMSAVGSRGMPDVALLPDCRRPPAPDSGLRPVTARTVSSGHGSYDGFRTCGNHGAVSFWLSYSCMHLESASSRLDGISGRHASKTLDMLFI